MKYCSKCGNELMDEAVICPKCGCPVENAEKPKKKRKKGLKIALIIFGVLMFFYILGSLFGDNTSDTRDISNIENQEIELTEDNISSYLSMDFSYSEMEETPFFSNTLYSMDVVLNTYPTIGGSFNNVDITVTVLLEDNMGWEVDGGDNAAKTSGDGYLSFSFRLPANGNYTESHGISSIFGVILNDDIRYEITDVSGTFTKE